MGDRLPRRDDEHGQVAVIVALSLTVMLAFGALVVDVGLSWAARSEAQTAADAAALAGVARLPVDPAGAVATVKAYLNSNLPGLDDGSGWDLNATDADGDITCWAPPAAVPAPGRGCRSGDTAIQVTTPPLKPTYAFAGIMGRRSGEVKALAAAGPQAATPPCALCVLDPDAPRALAVTGAGGIDVSGAGVVVNSDAADAAVLSGSGGVTAPSIGVVGGVQTSSSGQFTPSPTLNVPPVADLLGGLPTPDQIRALPPRGSVVVTPSTPMISEGVYDRIVVGTSANLRMSPGIYVVTGELTLSSSGSVLGAGVTVYLTCFRYPQPCNGPGATFTQSANGRFLATPPASGPYKGLAIFADRTNTAAITLSSNSTGSFLGTIYAAAGELRLSSGGGTLRLNSLVVAGTVRITSGSETDLVYDPGQNAAISPSSSGLIK